MRTVDPILLTSVVSPDYSSVLQHIRSLFQAPEGQFLPLHAPVFEGNEKAYLLECIDSTFVSSVGAFVDRFEREVAQFTGAEHAVAVSNGTLALHLALLLAGVRAGDGVITQSLTFVATCNAIRYLGAEPVFVDVDPDSLSLSPTALEAFLHEHTHSGPEGLPVHTASGRRLSAVVPMHCFGHVAHIRAIAEVCQRHHLTLVEDAAESLGSWEGERHTGTIGSMGTLSLNGNKTITSGGGGVVLTHDAQLAKRAKHLSTQAKQPHAWEFRHDEVGYNYRMPNLNAALAVAQLEQLPVFLARKRKLAQAYARFFAGVEGVDFVTERTGTRSNYWLNAVLLPGRQQRDAFLEQSNKQGVMTRPAWEPMHQLPMFEAALRGPLPVTEDLVARLVNIPSSPVPQLDALPD